MRIPKKNPSDYIQTADSIVLKWALKNPDKAKAKATMKKLKLKDLFETKPYKDVLESWKKWRDFYGLPKQQQISPNLIKDVVDYCKDEEFNLVIMLGSVCREYRKNWGLATMGQILVDGMNIYRKNCEEVVKDLELL